MIPDELRLLLAFITALFSAIFIIPKLANIARSIGLMDQPGERKVHTLARPLVGGISIVIAATFSAMLFADLAGYRGLFLGLALLLFIGFLDDFRELGSKSKFVAQIFATILMMCFSKVFLISFGDLCGFGPINLPDYNVAIWLVTIFCVVGVVNSINLIDGLDGLAGGISFIAFLTFALHASFAGEIVLTVLNLAFAGAVLGFLRFNWHPSIVFMGDAGSLSIGFVLGFMAIALTQGENGLISPVIPLLVLAVPITDTITVMTKRILKGNNPFKADQYHLHHIFMRYGLGRETVVKIIIGLSIVLSGITLLVPFYHIPDHVLFSVYIFYFGCYVVSSFFIVYTLRVSLKYRKNVVHNRGKKDSSVSAAQFLLDKLDLLRIFRKDVRYHVDLSIEIRIPGNGEKFQGKLRNISQKGCMASIENLNELYQEVEISFSVPMDNNVITIIFPSEHLWMTETGETILHGFRFSELSSENNQAFEKFMDRIKKHTVFVQSWVE